MKVELKNKVFKFNNISIKETITKLKINKYIIIQNSMKYNNYLFQKNLKYETFLTLLKNSLDIYVDTTDYENVIDECFNYFKITTNQLVKINMSQKIAYMIIKSKQNNNDSGINKLRSLLNNYFENKTGVINDCDELIFLKIIANIDRIDEHIPHIFDLELEENEYCLLDFILDSYD